MTRRPTDLRHQLEGTTAPSPTTPPAAAVASNGASTPAPAEGSPPSKFTVLLDPDDAAGFDQLAVDIRRLLGRRVSKGDLVRALIALVAADPTLRDQLLHQLRDRPTSG
jgi:hypothetical protein